MSTRIGIIGSGAVGCYYGGRLAQAGRDVRFLMRRDLDHARRVLGWKPVDSADTVR